MDRRTAGGPAPDNARLLQHQNLRRISGRHRGSSPSLHTNARHSLRPMNRGKQSASLKMPRCSGRQSRAALHSRCREKGASREVWPPASRQDGCSGRLEVQHGTLPSGLLLELPGFSRQIIIIGYNSAPISQGPKVLGGIKAKGANRSETTGSFAVLFAP